MSVTPTSRLSAAQDVRARRFHEEIVLLDLARGEYFSLDELGAQVWEGLEAGQSVADVVTALAPHYDTDVARFEADILAFAHELVRRHLMVETLK